MNHACILVQVCAETVAETVVNHRALAIVVVHAQVLPFNHVKTVPVHVHRHAKEDVVPLARQAVRALANPHAQEVVILGARKVAIKDVKVLAIVDVRVRVTPAAKKVVKTCVRAPARDIVLADVQIHAQILAKGLVWVVIIVVWGLVVGRVFTRCIIKYG